MAKTYTFLILFLSLSAFVKAQEYPTTSWSDSADTSWYDSNQDEFSISSAEELAGIAELVVQGTFFENKTITIDSDINLDAHLWTPIGVDTNSPFSGTVEGNNHIISNLWINLPEEDYVGLFGQCTEATLSNINIETSHIIAGDTSGTLVGDFSTNGLIVNCHVSDISFTGSSYNCGGLAGSVRTNSSITKCSAAGDVIGANQTGGLVGTAYNKTSITQSYSEGTVSGSYLIGGLVGYCTVAYGGGGDSFNTVDNCYSRASVTAEDGRAGGLYGGSDGDLILLNSYTTGTVSAPEFEGAVIGAWGGGPGLTVENIYFDTETSELTDGIGGFTAAEGTYTIEGRTTADMKTTELVDLLNESSEVAPWGIDANVNDGYPVFSDMLSTTSFQSEGLSLIVYPTVFDNQLTVSTQLNLKSYRIYNTNGVLVTEGNFEGNKTITTGNLSAGIYILKINAENGTLTKKVIKK